MTATSVRERHRRAIERSAPRLHRPNRKWRLIPVAIGVVVVLLVAVTGKLFLWPSPAAVPKHADAVFVLPGGNGDRLPRALGLMSREVAPVLVLPGGSTPAWPAANNQCSIAQRYQVICPRAPGSTRANAELARNLSSHYRWGLIIVVTSRSNLTRARLDFDRCLAAGFGMASSTRHVGAFTKLHVIVDEWAGWIDDGLIHRSC